PAPTYSATLSLHDAFRSENAFSTAFTEARRSPAVIPALEASARPAGSGAGRRRPRRSTRADAPSRPPAPGGRRGGSRRPARATRSEEHTSELQSLAFLVC